MTDLPVTVADWLGEVEIRDAGSCWHRPISNGWSASLRQSPYSWCGHCKAYVEHDDEWRTKFAAAGRCIPKSPACATPGAGGA